MRDTLLSDEALLALNARLEPSHPREIVRWALEESGLREIALASAFQAEGTCVMHMATRIRPDVPVLFLETGFHFAETLAFKRRLTELLDLNVFELAGAYTPATQREAFGPRLYEREPERCCDINKVRPMLAALRGREAWITAFRRDSSPTRATAPIIDRYELEPGSWIVKVNPALARRRTRARGPVGRPVEMGVRDPGARRRIRTGRERGRGEAGREGLGHDPERLGCEVDLEAPVVAERVPVHLDRERRLRGDQHVACVVNVVDVPPMDVARRAEHLPRDPRDASAGQLADREHVQT
jgi:phosphoadenylyl-sulfate reductase (thioredoxin)